MRVAITGATGNVGTSVIEALAAETEVEEIVGLARRRPGWDAPKTTWVAADVAESDLVPHFRGVDAVVHLAWLFQPTHRPDVTWHNNVEGSIRAFRAAAAAGVRVLVYASSVGAYSPGPQDRAVDESWPTDAIPTAAYGREKAYLERVLDAFELEHPDIRTVRLRPAFIFKRESSSEQRRLFMGPFVPRALVRRGLVPIVPDVPGLRFQGLHGSDAGEAFRLALVRDVRGAFNIAAEPVLDAHSLAELLRARAVTMPAAPLRAVVAAAWRLRLVPASPFLVDLALSLPIMDVTRARTELGWEPRVSALDALREVIDGIREGAGMQTPPLEPARASR